MQISLNFSLFWFIFLWWLSDTSFSFFASYFILSQSLFSSARVVFITSNIFSNSSFSEFYFNYSYCSSTSLASAALIFSITSMALSSSPSNSFFIETIFYCIWISFVLDTFNSNSTFFIFFYFWSNFEARIETSFSHFLNSSSKSCLFFFKF